MDLFRATFASATPVRLAIAGLALPLALALSSLPASARSQGVVGECSFTPVATAAASPSPLAVPPTGPAVVVRIDLSAQTMEVWVEGRQRHVWPISTARRGYRTPVGSYQPYRMHKRYFSRRYDNAAMPHAIFFTGGYAIHGTTDLRRLGRPASHGCVRLHPKNAAALFGLVSALGRGNTEIVITR